MTVTESPALYPDALDVETIEARWGNPDTGLLGQLYTEEQMARASSDDVWALIAEVRRARQAFLGRSHVDKGVVEGLEAENATLRQANADARDAIRELRETVKSLEAANEAETPEPEPEV
jgi:hypothetical protein